VESFPLKLRLQNNSRYARIAPHAVSTLFLHPYLIDDPRSPVGEVSCIPICPNAHAMSSQEQLKTHRHPLGVTRSIGNATRALSVLTVSDDEDDDEVQVVGPPSKSDDLGSMGPVKAEVLTTASDPPRPFL
jgi:hypothetical protein